MMQIFPVLNTEHLFLRNIRPTDLEYVFRLFNTIENIRYYEEFLMEDITEARDYITRVNEDFQKGISTHWGIAGDQDNIIKGLFAAKYFDRQNNSCRISFLLNQKSRKKGIMSEAFESILNHLIISGGINRISCDIAPEDKKSEKILVSYGFIKEGVSHSSVKTGQDSYKDSVVYAYTRK